MNDALFLARMLMVAVPVFALAIGLLIYARILDKRIEAEERDLPPAE